MLERTPILIGREMFTLMAQLEVDSLDPENMPEPVEGELEYADGGWDDFALRTDGPEKRMWLLGDRFPCRLRMVGSGSRFVVERDPPPAASQAEVSRASRKYPPDRA